MHWLELPTHCYERTIVIMDWKQAIENWRRLPRGEQQRRRLEAIPHHVALSMAVEGEPVPESDIRRHLQRRLAASTPPDASKPDSEF